MFSFFQRAPDATLQLYGKLPIAKDYLRIGCGAGAAQQLRDWLDAAFSTNAEDGKPPKLMRPLRFLWPSPAGDPLLGVLWQSCDAGGLRPFPLALAVERRKRALLSELESGWSALEGWWRALESVHGTLGSFGDGSALLTALRGVQVKPEALPELGTSIPSVWPEAERCLSRIASLRGHADREPIAVPLSSSLPLAAQGHAWWRVLLQAKALDPQRAPAFFAASADSAGPGYAVFLQQGPSTRELPWVLGMRACADIEGEGDHSDSATALQELFRRALASSRAGPRG